jgi:beta-lactamase class A
MIMGQSQERKYTHTLGNIIISFISLILIFTVVGYGLVSRELQPIASADALAGTEVMGAQTVAQAKTIETPTTPSLTTDNIQAMTQSMQSAIASTNADVSVSIVDIKTGDAYNYGYTGTFLGASVNKLVTATLVLHMIDQGKLSLNTIIDGQTTTSLLTKMIEQSDNNAWQSLNDKITSKELRAWAKTNGWNSFVFDTNEVNTADIAKLLDALYKGTLLSDASRQFLLQHMANANEANHIVQNVPSGITVYHKAGWLSDYLHDAAIIDNGNRPYVLVIFTKDPGIYGSAKAANIYKQITKATLTAFGL